MKKIFMTTKNEKYCLVPDESGHWYCIPLMLKKRFKTWVYQEEDENDIPEDFDEYRLNMHLSNYCFENFKEIK